MPQAIIKLGEFEDRILTMVRGQYGLKNKSEAVNFLIGKYAKDYHEPQLKPEYIEKLTKLENEGIYYEYSSLEDLRKDTEDGRITRGKKVGKKTLKNN